jgi:ABC-type multidrug transport system ATPase subunit
MVTRPAVLFLDECTTGLDSASALAVMRMVAGIAARGTAVVCRYKLTGYYYYKYVM